MAFCRQKNVTNTFTYVSLMFVSCTFTSLPVLVIGQSAVIWQAVNEIHSAGRVKGLLVLFTQQCSKTILEFFTFDALGISVCQ